MTIYCQAYSLPLCSRETLNTPNCLDKIHLADRMKEKRGRRMGADRVIDFVLGKNLQTVNVNLKLDGALQRLAYFSQC